MKKTYKHLSEELRACAFRVCSKDTLLPNFLIQFKIFSHRSPNHHFKEWLYIWKMHRKYSFITLYEDRLDFDCLLRNYIPLVEVLSIPAIKHPRDYLIFFIRCNYFSLSWVDVFKKLLTGAGETAPLLSTWCSVPSTHMTAPNICNSSSKGSSVLL